MPSRYTPEQRRVIRKSRRTARRLKASPREEKSLYLAERVESNFRDLKYGDRDSGGALQQRPSQGWGPASEPVETDVKQFLKAAKKINRRGFKGSAGQLAQAVQRSAFPGRYDQHSAEGDQLTRGGVKGSAPNTRQGSSSSETTTTSYRSTPGTDYSTERRDAKLAYLQDSHNPDALLNLGLTLRSLKDTPGTSSKVVKRSGSSSSSSSGGSTGTSTSGSGGRVKVDPNADRPGAHTHKSVVKFARKISATAGQPVRIGTGTNHNQMTVDGNVSDHWAGHAADIPATGRRLIHLGQSALIAAGMNPKQARKQHGGLFNVGGHQVIFNTHEGGDHTNHLHVSA